MTEEPEQSNAQLGTLSVRASDRQTYEITDHASGQIGVRIAALAVMLLGLLTAGEAVYAFLYTLSSASWLLFASTLLYIVLALACFRCAVGLWRSYSGARSFATTLFAVVFFRQVVNMFEQPSPLVLGALLFAVAFILYLQLPSIGRLFS